MKTVSHDIYVNYDDVLYKFLKIWQADDGSFYTEFVHTRRTRQQQKLRFDFKHKGNNITSNITEKCDVKVQTNQIRISYHTTGMIKYHGLERNIIYLEPLTRIKSGNTFFMVSIPSLSSLDKVDEINPNAQVIPIDNYIDQRFNFYMSIIPHDYPFNTIEGLIIAAHFPLYTFVVVGEIDDATLNFDKQIPEGTFLFYSPHDGYFKNQIIKKEEAFLEYKHSIYQTKELIVLPPTNTNNLFRMIFVVEMRVPPMVNIEFENKHLEIRAIEKSTTEIRFKIYNKNSNQPITEKDAGTVEIKSIMLDSNIYPDDYIFPSDYI